jgi:hypothetical protein
MTLVIPVRETDSESDIDVPIEENESDNSTTDQVPDSQDSIEILCKTFWPQR